MTQELLKITITCHVGLELGLGLGFDNFEYIFVMGSRNCSDCLVELILSLMYCGEEC